MVPTWKRLWYVNLFFLSIYFELFGWICILFQQKRWQHSSKCFKLYNFYKKRYWIQKIPQKRVSRPQRIKNKLLFLLSFFWNFFRRNILKNITNKYISRCLYEDQKGKSFSRSILNSKQKSFNSKHNPRSILSSISTKLYSIQSGGERNRKVFNAA